MEVEEEFSKTEMVSVWANNIYLSSKVQVFVYLFLFFYFYAAVCRKSKIHSITNGFSSSINHRSGFLSRIFIFTSI